MKSADFRLAFSLSSRTRLRSDGGACLGIGARESRHGQRISYDATLLVV